MKLLDILKTVGGGLISTMVPGGPAIVTLLNGVLPSDQQLPETATGVDALAVLNPEKHADLLNKEYEVDITQIKESNETLRAMLATESVSKQTTRPNIAMGSFYVSAYAAIIAISIWAYAVITAENPLKAVVDGWQFIGIVIAPFVTLMWAYMGIIKQEHKNRLDTASGNSTPSGITSILSSILTRK
jgi:hypothetical protein